MSSKIENCPKSKCNLISISDSGIFCNEDSGKQVNKQGLFSLNNYFFFRQTIFRYSIPSFSLDRTFFCLSRSFISSSDIMSPCASLALVVVMTRYYIISSFSGIDVLKSITFYLDLLDDLMCWMVSRYKTLFYTSELTFRFFFIPDVSNLHWISSASQTGEDWLWYYFDLLKVYPKNEYQRSETPTLHTYDCPVVTQVRLYYTVLRLQVVQSDLPIISCRCIPTNDMHNKSIWSRRDIHTQLFTTNVEYLITPVQHRVRNLKQQWKSISDPDTLPINRIWRSRQVLWDEVMCDCTVVVSVCTYATSPKYARIFRI